MVDSQAERVALLTSLVRSFRVPSHINPDSQAALPMTVRQAEASLDPIALLDKANANGMKVVGLFNRYDLRRRISEHAVNIALCMRKTPQVL